MKTLLYEFGTDLELPAVVFFRLVRVDAFNNEDTRLAV